MAPSTVSLPVRIPVKATPSPPVSTASSASANSSFSAYLSSSGSPPTGLGLRKTPSPSKSPPNDPGRPDPIDVRQLTKNATPGAAIGSLKELHNIHPQPNKSYKFEDHRYVSDKFARAIFSATQVHRKDGKIVSGVRNKAVDAKVGQEGGCEDHDGSHLVACQLGGHSSRLNLAAAHKTLNRVIYREREIHIYKMITKTLETSNKPAFVFGAVTYQDNKTTAAKTMSLGHCFGKNSRDTLDTIDHSAIEWRTFDNKPCHAAEEPLPDVVTPPVRRSPRLNPVDDVDGLARVLERIL